MAYQSKNMSYIFYTEYFEGMDLGKTADEGVEKKNKDLIGFQFQGDTPVSKWKELEGFQEIALYTTYPGLLIGSGIEHRLQKDSVLKLGFSFDHVTGLPYIPGSSVKGMLRSCFPGDGKSAEESCEYRGYIRDILKKPELDVEALKREIFEGEDVFLGAFPVISTENDKTMLAMDYITPHKDQFKGPNAISFLKVKPNVQFEFCFLLKDSAGTATAEEKRTLFETLLLDMGIGSKTNVGFGRFSKTRTMGVKDHAPQNQRRENSNRQNRNNSGTHNGRNFGGYQQQDSGKGTLLGDLLGNQPTGNAPECKNKGCKRKVSWDSKGRRGYSLCQECSRKRK